MKFEKGFLYHVYNQANAGQEIFPDASAYRTFLEKVVKWVKPQCDILAYCLMPNHYHFLIHATDRSETPKKIGSLDSNELSNGFRILQSQYAQYFNSRTNSSGSIFRPRTKAKCLNDRDHHYVITCFLYILQNPVKAGLCMTPFDWKYSSIHEYIRKPGSIPKVIAKERVEEFIDIDFSDLEKELQLMIPPHMSKRFF